jgi:uncharacterized protein (TIGR03089 family)
VENVAGAPPTSRADDAPGTLLDSVAAQLRHDPGQPCLTFYDASTGERIELSWVTFDNWTSKVANLFTDDLDAQPGERIAIDLAAHWLGPAVLFGAWAAGLVAAYDGAVDHAAVRVVGPDALADGAGGGTVVACSLRPLGGRFTEPLPPGWLDFAAEVPSQPDVLLMPASVTPATVATTSSSGDITHGDLAHAGVARAAELGLAQGGRLATDLNPVELTSMATALGAPWSVGGSVVLVVNADHDQRTEIAAQERVSCSFWSD